MFRRQNKFTAFLISLALLFVSPAAVLGVWTPGNFEIHVFQVGQADSQLIISPTGRTLLIDVGETHYRRSQGAQSVAQKIHNVMGANFNHIDYIVATHLHADHIGYVGRGGIWGLIENHGFTVGNLIDRDAGVWNDTNQDGQPSKDEIVWHNAGTTSGTGWRWIGYVTDPNNAARLNREIARVGSTTQIDLGPGVTVTVIESDANGVKMVDGTTDVSGNHVGGTIPPSENDYSITLKVSFGILDYVTGGDTDGEYATSRYGYNYNDVESVIAPRIGKIEILHVNHHGSGHSSNYNYLSTLDPDVSLISCGNNSYGHPDQGTLDRLLATNTVYLTDQGEPNRNYGSAIIVYDDIVIESSNGVDYTVNGDSYWAPDPVTAAGDIFEVIDYIVGEMEWGNIVFNTPSSMQFKKTETIELLLSHSVSTKELQKQLENVSIIESARVKISNRMEALLSGTGFQVEALFPKVQSVSSKGVIKWKWYVTPTKQGLQRLHLTLSAILNVSDRDAPFVIRTFDRTIEVKVSLAHRASSFFSKNWKWLWAAVLIPIATFYWKWRKKKGTKTQTNSEGEQEKA
jgi:beta-lactamase superfamily II metal-dependent hydrolase